MKKRILVDLLHIRDCNYSGIGNVAIDLVKGLLMFSDYDIVLLVWDTLDLDTWIDKNIVANVDKILLPVKFQTDIDKKHWIHFCPAMLKYELDKKKIEIIFTPRYSVKSYVFPHKYKHIGVVHDIQHIKIRRGKLSFFYYYVLTVIYYNLINCAIAISGQTKKDIRKISGKKSVVIYNSVTLQTNKAKIIKNLENEEYILDVNSLFKYKNAERLIDAFRMLKNIIPHTLYLKGGASDHDRALELKKYIKNLGLDDRVVVDISNYTSEEMNYLYNNAKLFVSPSLMEGFGLTPIEASLHKIPVVVSNIDTFLEVSDGKFKSFDPFSVNSIADCIYSMLNNPPTNEELENIALYFKEKYSLSRQIERYKEVIDQYI